MNIYNFTINGKNYSIVNQVKETRNGFKHESSLIINGMIETLSVKINYINRTWERFQFESSMKKLISSYFLSADDIKVIYKQLGIESL
jgi:hypothetical protein